jgi:hypothetical protein
MDDRYRRRAFVSTIRRVTRARSLCGVWNGTATSAANGHLTLPAAVRTNTTHSQQALPENYRGYVQTELKPEREPDRHGVYALDCEMCHTTYDVELIRVAVVDHNYQVVYDQLVKPRNPILDYNTQFSGIVEGDLVGVRTTLADVQRHSLDLFSDKTILVGHSLDRDMIALKMFHKRFVDTAHLYPRRRGLPWFLRTRVQEKHGSPTLENDCKQDPTVALRLVKRRCTGAIPFHL